MKKIVVFLPVILCFSTLQKACSQSVHFEQLSWQQALAKAKKENKMLFIDVQTSWCSYCKQMDQNIFPLKEVGDFYNSHFINLKYDAQASDGIAIRKSYALLGFPTFLYLDANGMVLKKTAGYQTKDVFIQNAGNAVLLLQQQVQASSTSR